MEQRSRIIVSPVTWLDYRPVEVWPKAFVEPLVIGAVVSLELGQYLPPRGTVSARGPG